MIQSITFLSEYADGTVDANYTLDGTEIIPATAEFNFMIRPQAAATKLAEMGASAISMQSYYTRTRSNFDFTDLPILDVSANGSILSISVSLENITEAFFRRYTTASAFMNITDGVSDISTEPIAMVSKALPDLSSYHSANSYLIIQSGDYRIKAVKGNSNERVGDVMSAEVLWESYGTSEAPVPGSLISNVSVDGDYVTFRTSDNFKEGNAVIAAKDFAGDILWSWHIWLVEDEIYEHTYASNAGVLMDRNLGALSTKPGDEETYGLLYQWGRKDPFIGLVGGRYTPATSTIEWSSATCSSTIGTIEYATMNPTTFIKINQNLSNNHSDWFYTGTKEPDHTRWASNKTVYDPCPIGWRVPDGGSNGVWAKAKLPTSIEYDSYGTMFSSPYCDYDAWYPFSGGISGYSASYTIDATSNLNGWYWSVTPNSGSSSYKYYSYGLAIRTDGTLKRDYTGPHAHAHAIRCQKVNND